MHDKFTRPQNTMKAATMCSFTAPTVLSLLVVMASLSLSSSSEAILAAMAPRHTRGAATAAEFLSTINEARADVGVPALSWNATIAQRAKAEVTWLRSTAGCDLAQQDRSPVPGVGALTTFRSHARRTTPADAVWWWVDKRRWYNHAANTCAAGKDCRSYTLVVMRAWQQLGCAVAACPSDGALMACEYSPGTNRLPGPNESPY